MRDPVLFLSTNPRDASVEVSRVLCGDADVAHRGAPAMAYKLGQPLRATATSEAPVRVTLRNNDMRHVRVGASLVAGEVDAREGE
jgi:hypothetical protein